MNKAVFLDRDGTIIYDKVYLNDPEQIEYIPGAIEGMKKLIEAGYILLVATNQSGIPRGLVQEENLHEIHKRMERHLNEHGVTVKYYYYAPFLVESNHPMRKPGTGMLDQGAKDFDVDLSKSWMVGDRMTDVLAGHSAGTKTVFLHGTEEPDLSGEVKPTLVCENLLEAAKKILR